MPYSVWPSAATRAAPSTGGVVKLPAVGALALAGQIPIVVSAGAFTDNFPSDNNPLPAPWRTIDTTYQTAGKSLGGRAFGTQPSGGGRPPYKDSNAVLSGFGTDYEIQGTIYRIASPTGISEIEILLRCVESGVVLHQFYGDTFLSCYEINLSHNGAYCNLGRFKEQNALQSAITTIPSFSSGSVFRARVQGQRIQAWVDSTQLIDFTDNAAGKLTAGDPGIGWYIDGGVGNEEFGFDSVTVTAL